MVEAGESRGPLKESTSSGAPSSPSPPINTITTHSRRGCCKAPRVGYHYDGEDGHIKGGVSPDSNHRFPGENSPFPPIDAIRAQSRRGGHMAPREGHRWEKEGSGGIPVGVSRTCRILPLKQQSPDKNNRGGKLGNGPEGRLVSGLIGCGA